MSIVINGADATPSSRKMFQEEHSIFRGTFVRWRHMAITKNTHGYGDTASTAVSDAACCSQQACDLPSKATLMAMPIKMCTTADFVEISNFHCDNFCVATKTAVRYRTVQNGTCWTGNRPAMVDQGRNWGLYRRNSALCGQKCTWECISRTYTHTHNHEGTTKKIKIKVIGPLRIQTGDKYK